MKEWSLKKKKKQARKRGIVGDFVCKRERKPVDCVVERMGEGEMGEEREGERIGASARGGSVNVGQDTRAASSKPGCLSQSELNQLFLH